MNNIIGNGLIAKSFLHKKIPEKTIIFSSGVSNSQCVDDNKFNREQKILQDTMLKYINQKIVYFSTCSVDYASKNKYIFHKLNMENLLKSHSNYKIYRVTQIVGMTTNDTLISYFTKSLIRNEKIVIKKNVKRNIVDVEDLCRIVEDDLNSTSINQEKISYIKSKHSVDVFLIYEKIANILNLPLNYKLVNCGNELNMDDIINPTIIKKDDIINHDLYWETVLEKYVKNLKKFFDETYIN